MKNLLVVAILALAASVAFSQVGSAPAADSVPVQWEYRAVYSNPPEERLAGTLETQLNNVAKEGWEYHGTFRDRVLIFKRPRPADEVTR